MKDIEFNAILAKNGLARTFKNCQSELRSIGFPVEYVLSLLRDIEKFIGEANQPSVESVFNSELDI